MQPAAGRSESWARMTGHAYLGIMSYIYSTPRLIHSPNTHPYLEAQMRITSSPAHLKSGGGGGRET